MSSAYQLRTSPPSIRLGTDGHDSSPNLHKMSGSTSSVSGDDQEPKKKKIRKGTTSCWECMYHWRYTAILALYTQLLTFPGKRRKTRCQFRSPSDDACIGCRRRETACLSQEHAEHPPQSASRSIVRIEERLERMESLLEKVAGNGMSSSKMKQRGGSFSVDSQTASDAGDYNILTPYSVNTPNPEAAPLLYSAVV
jgi:hypothetical protein